MGAVSQAANREERHNEQGLTCSGVDLAASVTRFDVADMDRPIRWNEGLGKRLLDHRAFERLQEACNLCSGLDRYYLPLAIYLATRVGIGLNEMCDVTWEDICLKKRRIEIRKRRKDRSNSDSRWTAVLPFMTAWYLERVALALEEDNRFNQMDRLFPMSARQLEKAWRFVTHEAGVGDRPFDHLRREASIAFGEAGLTKQQHDLMLGYGNNILPIPNSELDSIRDKLDWLVLGGQTYEEAKGSIPLIEPNTIIRLSKWLSASGLTKPSQSTPDVITHFPIVLLTKL